MRAERQGHDLITNKEWDAKIHTDQPYDSDWESITTLVSLVAAIITGSLLIGLCWEFSDLVRILAILTVHNI